MEKVIVDQVRNGVAVRMAVLFELLGSGPVVPPRSATTPGGPADRPLPVLTPSSPPAGPSADQ